MLRSELGHSLKFLGRQRLLAFLIIATLAIGLGANAAVFGVLDAVIFRTIPVLEPERLAVLWSQTTTSSRAEKEGVGASDYRNWRASATSFEDLAAVRYQGYSLTQEGEPAELLAAEVTANFFQVVGLSAVLGRPFGAEDVRAGEEQVVLLSHRLWTQRFGGEPDVVGRQLPLGGVPYVVLGVLPSEFRFPNDDVDLWLPMLLDIEEDKARNLHLLGRLSDGVSLAQARDEMDQISVHLARDNPEIYEGRRALVVSLGEQLTGHLRPLLWVLTGAALAILIICWVNLASLFLAHVLNRRNELFVRSALGAGRASLIRQLLLESLVMAVLAGIIGIGVSSVIANALIRICPVDLPHDVAIFSPTGLMYLFVTAVVMGLAIGVIAAIQGARLGSLRIPNAAGRRTVGARSGAIGRQTLVVSQIAVSLALLVGAGLMIRSVTQLAKVEPGWNPDQVLGTQVYLSGRLHPQPHQWIQMVENLQDRLRGHPEVKSIGISTSLPGTEVGIDFALPINIVGTEPDPSHRAGLRAISGDYFKSLGVPLVQGRDFDSRDNPESRRVVIVNRAFVQRFLAERTDILGVNVTIPFRGRNDWEIVGVVGDIHHQGLDRAPQPEFYLPFSQAPFSGFAVATRATRDVDQLVGVVQEALWSIDSEQPISWLGRMDEVVADSLEDRRFVMLLLTVLGLIAVLSSGLGIYGVAMFNVQRRVSEIGVRMVLGATPGSVVRAVLAQAMRWVVGGLAVGAVVASLVGHWLDSYLFEVSSWDARVVVTAAVLLVLIAVFSAGFPAWRAARIDPADALRID